MILNLDCDDALAGVRESIFIDRSWLFHPIQSSREICSSAQALFLGVGGAYLDQKIRSSDMVFPGIVSHDV